MTPENAIDRVCPNCQTTVHAVGQSPVRCPSCQTLIPAPPATDDALPNLSDLEHSADAPVGVQKPASTAASDSPQLPTVDSPDIGEADDSPLPAKAADLSGHDDVYGVVCRICDTRIHVRPEQVGQEIECPVCFSPVKVTAKVDKQKVWGRGGATYLEPASRDPHAQTDEDSGELKLADLDDAPKTPAARQPPATAPPKPAAPAVDDDDDDLPRLQPLEDPEPAPKPKAPTSFKKKDATSAASPVSQTPAADDEDRDDDPSESKADTKPSTEPSRRQKLAAAEFRRQQAEADQGFARPASADLADDFPEFEIGALAGAIGRMVSAPGVLMRAVAALLLMLVGVVIIAVLSQTGAAEGEPPPMFERLVTWLLQGIGLAVYLLGLFGLWFVCGTLFRDAASGLDRVRTWQVQGTSELLGTWLLFGFSMFIAGLPMLFLSPLVLPLRILVGPLFLLAAWFNRSAWFILSVDVFQGTRKISGQWSTLYTMLVMLAAAGLLSGGLLWMRGLTDILLIDLALSVVAVVLHVAVMLAFAPLAGWHVGLVMKLLERE